MLRRQWDSGHNICYSSLDLSLEVWILPSSWLLPLQQLCGLYFLPALLIQDPRKPRFLSWSVRELPAESILSKVEPAKGQSARGNRSPREVPVQAHTGRLTDWERDGKGVNHKKEPKSKNNMDELGEHYATWNMPDPERRILYGLTSICGIWKKSLLEPKNKTMAARGWEEGGVGGCC